MAIGPVNFRYTINLQGNNIELTDSLKNLGVTLDEKITFKHYIQEQLKKTCAKAAALCKLCKFIPQDVMIHLYKAYELPHLGHCSPLLLGISNGLKNKSEDPKSGSQFQPLVILYKCLRGQGPEYLSEFFNVLNVNYNLRGPSTRLMLPSFNLEYMHKSWSYLTTKLWNGLPTRVRECPDLASFRRPLLSFMARLYFNFAGLSRIWVAGLDTYACCPIHMNYFNSSNFNFNAHSIAN